MDFITLLLLGASLALNFAGAWQMRLQQKRFAAQLEAQKKRPAPTLSAEEILHDLTATGRTMLRIERINEADVFLRSPRT